MLHRKSLFVVLGLASLVSFAAVAQVDWILPYTSPVGSEALVSFSNTTGTTVDVLHLEFAEEVTVTYSMTIGGTLTPLGAATGTVFDFAGELVPHGELFVTWEPASAFPVYGTWLVGQRPTGIPLVGSVAVLGRLFGQGIVHAREADPEGLTAAFAAFFADNAEFLGELSASLGMSLQDSLMPIIMEAPAEGIENFFNTIVGMLGVSSLEEVIGGDMDFSALFAFLGL